VNVFAFRSTDPLARLGRRDRREWRRIERRAITQHRVDRAAALARLSGSVVRDVHASPLGTVVLTVAGRQIALSDVAAVARAHVVEVARGGCHLAAGGRYGAFWWLAIEGDPATGGRRATVLGTHLRLHPAGGTPDPVTPGLTPEGLRKEDSLL
jgi:hypothetical protein